MSSSLPIIGASQKHGLLFVLVLGVSFPSMAGVRNGLPPDPFVAARSPSDRSTSPADPAISESTGSVELALPIEVPPGPAGFTPDLSLLYSSHSGSDGPFGLGWNLTLGEIHCTARFGVPDYADCPQYELNGELLVGPDGAGHYHTFIETFQRIRKLPYTGGDGWEVAQLDGTIMRFGVDPSSRVYAGSTAARWLLAEMQSTHGNRIYFTYEARGDTGIAYPVRITYGFGATSTSAPREIRFVYEDRPDPLLSFAGGIESKITQRLREIQILSLGGVFRRHVVGYSSVGEYATHRSRLAWVQQFGSDCPISITDPTQSTTCTPLPAKTFEYSDPGDTLGTNGWQWQAPPGGSPWDPPFFFVEPNSSVEAGVRFGDVDGDGRLDMIRAFCDDADYPCDSDTKGLREVWLNTGSGWAKSTAWSNAFGGLSWESVISTVHVWADQNGHDRQICDVTHEAAMRRIAFSERRPDNVPLSIVPNPSIGQAPLLSTYEMVQRWHLVDLNGDGRVDLVTSTRVGASERFLDCDGTVLDPEDLEFLPIPGIYKRIVFLNSGNGWVRDVALEDGLPVFEDVSFPRVHSGPSTQGGVSSSICAIDGLAGPHWSGDGAYRVCIGWMNLQPQWVELNGDGRLDLVVLEPESPAYALHDFWNPIEPLYSNLWSVGSKPGVSAAWLQASDGSGWRRTANLPFQHMSTRHIDDAVEWGFGGPQEYDSGVRFADLNRDGLTDVIWTDPFVAFGPIGTPPHTHFNAPSDARGLLINTGVWCTDQHPDPCTPDAGTGWCSSDAGGPCADQRDRHVPPVDFVSSQWHAYGRVPWPEYVMLVDVNGDGWTDLMKTDPLTPDGAVASWLYDPSAPGGSVWVQDVRFGPPAYSLITGVVQVLDVDTDGAVDFLKAGRSTNSSNAEQMAILSQSRLPDLLVEYDNGLGGVTRFSHAMPAGQQDAARETDAAAHAENTPGEAEASASTGITFWPLLPVVVSETVEGLNLLNDGDPGTPIAATPSPATTNYAYARPRRCLDHRVDLGFRLVEATRPDGSRGKSYFHQAHGRTGRLSEQSVWDEEGPVSFVKETWDLPDPTSVGTPPTSIAGAHVGRLTSRISRTEYGGSIGTSIGAVHLESFSYDDDYGYNFISEIESQRPTGTLRSVRTPLLANTSAWLIGLLQTQTQQDAVWQTLEATTFAYTDHGDVLSRTAYRRKRYSTDNLVALVTSFTYDTLGNLTQIRDPGQRATDYCYDGDGGWCPSPVKRL
jgi:hypothetical protein